MANTSTTIVERARDTDDRSHEMLIRIRETSGRDTGERASTMIASPLRRTIATSRNYLSQPLLLIIRRRLIAVAFVVILPIALGAGYLVAIEQRYQSARESAELVRDRYATSGAESDLNLQDLPTLAEDLNRLESDLADLQGLVDAPIFGRIARHAPIIGQDVEASQQFIRLGREMAAIARDATEIANTARLTFESTGMSTSDRVTGLTWLDIVRGRTAEIEELERRFTSLTRIREEIDEDHLPANARALLPEVDRLLATATEIRDEYLGLLPLLDTAFGGNGDANYVILLQNREEIRPGGGFPGTFACVTLRNGQLGTFDIYNIRRLDADYVARRTTPITSPGPIREVLNQAEFLPHDSLWSPDFTESVQTFLDMYRIAGWPEPTGVIGMNDSVVRDILASVGPYALEIDGQTQTITAENFMELIESRRDLSWQDLAAHKRFVAILGASLIDQIETADFATKKQIYFALREAADRREVQIHMVDPAMQAEVVARNWDGALVPDGTIPTLATTVAGLTGGKKALTIHQQLLIEITSSANGHHLRLTVTLDHQGDPDGNPVYNGYEYAWLSVYLPDGAKRILTSRDVVDAEVADDQRATSFGIGIMPGMTKETTIEFEITTTDRILVRRQSGFSDVDVRIVGDAGTCWFDWSFSLSRDIIISLESCDAAPANE